MVSQSVETIHSAPHAGNSHETTIEGIYQGRSIHAEHMLAVRRNVLATDTAMRIASLFAVLSDPTRLQVVYALLRAESGELCVGDLATGLGRDDTTISHQLRVLRNQQIVAMRKVGRIVYYRLVDEHIRLLLELGMTHINETSTSSKEGNGGAGMSDGHSHSGHNHTHGLARNSLRLAFFLTLIILIAEVVGGLLANSLALLSDAGHVVTDIFALGLAWFATVQAERPPNARKTFGYHRVGILAAMVNAVTLIVIAFAIILEAVQRFQHPEKVQPQIMFLAAGIGIVINLIIGFGLFKEANNLNVRAAMLHVFGDVGASAGVIVAGVIILFTGWTFVDPLLSVGIAVLIAIGAWRILRETTDILLESVPKGVSMPGLVKDMKSVEGIEDVHDLHVWSITSNMYALSCHALIADLPPSDSSVILHSLNTMLSEKYHIGHVTIQFECDPHQETYCAVNGLYCHMEMGENCNHNHAERSVVSLDKEKQVAAE